MPFRPRAGRHGTAGRAAFVLEIAVGAGLLLPTLAALPERALGADLSDDRGASDWAHRAMDIMEPDAVVLSWWSYSTTLWYVQLVEGRRPDVWILDDRTRLDQNLGDASDVIKAQLGRRPVYLIRGPGDEDLATVTEEYDIQQFQMPTDQSLLRILGRRVP